MYVEFQRSANYDGRLELSENFKFGGIKPYRSNKKCLDSAENIVKRGVGWSFDHFLFAFAVVSTRLCLM